MTAPTSTPLVTVSTTPFVSSARRSSVVVARVTTFAPSIVSISVISSLSVHLASEVLQLTFLDLVLLLPLLQLLLQRRPRRLLPVGQYVPSNDRASIISGQESGFRNQDHLPVWSLVGSLLDSNLKLVFVHHKLGFDAR